MPGPLWFLRIAGTAIFSTAILCTGATERRGTLRRATHIAVLFSAGLNVARLIPPQRWARQHLPELRPFSHGCRNRLAALVRRRARGQSSAKPQSIQGQSGLDRGMRVTEFYIILAVFLAVSLNQSSRIVRALGTLTAALALVMIAYSIVLANFDGTFAAIPAGAGLDDRIKPFVLNAQAGVALIGALFLLWAAWAQGMRRVTGPLPLRNTDTVFGRVSRYAHWIIGLLILILLPMGLLVSLLGPDHPDRAVYLGTHQMLGLTVLLLVVFRVLWLIQSPAPPMRADLNPSQRNLAKVTHVGLYVLMLGFPVTGVLLTAWSGEALDVFGWSPASLVTPDAQLAGVAATLHNLVLPAAFYIAIFAHLGAVTKHHFAERRLLEVRRMLR